MVRRQLSMFAVAGPETAAVEAVRRLVDPRQHSLIPAHVTLCRDADMDQLPVLCGMRFAPLRLTFGRPHAFSGHGVLLPCIDGDQAFQLLREQILGAGAVRQQHPHITLAHPRNPPCAHDALAIAASLPDPLCLVFDRIHLIEQTGENAWRVLETFGPG